MEEPFKLEYQEGVPVAYVPFVRDSPASAKQVVVSLADCDFTVKELIFDLDSEGNALGVELL